jgi:hypothetical protein
MQKEVNMSDCTFQFLLVYTESLAKSANVSDIDSDRNQPSFLPSMAAKDATPRASTANTSNIQNIVISLDMILPYIAFTRSCMMTSAKIKDL